MLSHVTFCMQFPLWLSICSPSLHPKCLYHRSHKLMQILGPLTATFLCWLEFFDLLHTATILLKARPQHQTYVFAFFLFHCYILLHIQRLFSPFFSILTARFVLVFQILYYFCNICSISIVELAYNFKLFPKRKTFPFARRFSTHWLLPTFCLLYNTKILVNGDIAHQTADLMLVQKQLEVFRSVLVGLLCVVLLFLCAKENKRN